ncbi:hypothetical protein DB88DRAFT_434533 [Papiliotrema laurentii]|uniref:tRNA-splicing endonuclease subunit Sen34 n=1 Tax=Papiliotrema laurentii TaxID=5418 RepID=A0AAD9FWE3_PAPLA|nr:hypothetical protein DB88DRAFT_434533 [Papiliotrema laurentii]
MDGPQPGPSRDSIPLYLVDGVATVWDPQVAATLHCSYGIGGFRAGTLPGVSQQNAFLGLPITLMREETAYLVSTGIAHLVPVARPALASPSDVAAHTAARVARIQAVEERKRKEMEKKSQEAQVAFERGGDKARAKREARAKARAEKLLAQGEGLSATEEVTAPTSSSIPVPVEPSQSKPTKRTSTINEHGYFFTVPAMPHIPSLSMQRPIHYIPNPLFPFPRSVRDRALVGTFKALSDQNYRIGLGPRFGGEYLIYPGDYLRYHAHFTSQVIVRDEPIKPTELVAWGRLGTGTKKAGLLCCWNDGKDGEEAGEGEVEFYSLEWANFG